MPIKRRRHFALPKRHITRAIWKGGITSLRWVCSVFQDMTHAAFIPSYTSLLSLGRMQLISTENARRSCWDITKVRIFYATINRKINLLCALYHVLCYPVNTVSDSLIVSYTVFQCHSIHRDIVESSSRLLGNVMMTGSINSSSSE